MDTLLGFIKIYFRFQLSMASHIHRATGVDSSLEDLHTPIIHRHDANLQGLPYHLKPQIWHPIVPIGSSGIERL